MSNRILLADDSEDMLILMRMVLLGADFTIVGSATNGDEALQMWRDSRPPEIFAVILDQRMPGRTGFEVAEQILAEEPNQRIILFSAQLEPGLAERAAALGVTACVAKEDVVNLPNHAALQA